MKKFITLLSLPLFLLLSSFQSQEIEMADKMRSDGLIYVLVLIVLLILGGLFFYLFTIERKVKKLEKENSEDKKE